MSFMLVQAERTSVTQTAAPRRIRRAYRRNPGSGAVFMQESPCGNRCGALSLITLRTRRCAAASCIALIVMHNEAMLHGFKRVPGLRKRSLRGVSFSLFHARPGTSALSHVL